VLALISDIHANIEALEAVLEDMASFPVERICCLGDVIGYGPDPREALEAVRRCEFVLLGNHEEGLLYSAEDFNDRARRALDWTRNELLSPEHSREENHGLWDLIDTFQTEVRDGDFLFVHGSPRKPINEYVMPADGLDRVKMSEIFAAQDRRVGFGGHTHVPGIFREAGGFQHQGSLPDRVPLPEGKSFVNIGSVGQPRDGDNRACYVLVEGDEIQFRRVAYDYVATMKKIRANPELHDFLAARLKVGQ
jgi:diadenosine tetraphosphatase ApaH/serine/threonine PP2A family protein phosphatase